MQSLLRFFNIPAIAVGLQVVAKGEAYRNVWVGVFKPEEVFSAYPSVFALKTTLQGSDKRLWHHCVYIVDVDVIVSALVKCAMTDGTATAEQIVQMLRSWEYI